MGFPEAGHLSRVLAAFGAALLSVGLAARSGMYPDDGRKVLVIGVIVGLAAVVLHMLG